MRILFSGTSSFTGAWFIRTLAEKGHQVTAILQKSKKEYQKIRKERIQWIAQEAKLIENCPINSPSFFSLLENQSWDLYCHHAAEVQNYKSRDFNLLGAVQNNTGDIASIMKCLRKAGCEKILLTGSVFESGEGAGSQNMPAVSAYGLSKGITSDIFRFYARQEKLVLGKFVIPNPFGPYEELRYPSLLARTWLQGQTARVTHPRIVRDNIPITLLAKAYAEAVETLTQPEQRWNPSFYIDSGEMFTKRMANELGSRYNVPCLYEIQEETTIDEPLVRINTEPLYPKTFGWNEEAFWDLLAEYYRERLYKKNSIFT